MSDTDQRSQKNKVTALDESKDQLKNSPSGQGQSRGENDTQSEGSKASSVSFSELLEASEDQRDSNWEEQFLAVFSQAQLAVIQEDVQQGPDGFSYLMVEDSPTKNQSALKVIDWLSQRGVGLVLNPQKKIPDYVFTYGMIWSFQEFGYFSKPQKTVPPEELAIEGGQEFFFGEPSSNYLPPYVRVILKEFFQQQNVLMPRVAMLSLDNKNFDLCWSLESLGDPPEKEHDDLAEAVSWFLPSDYSIVFMKEKQLSSKNFFIL